MTSKSHRRRSSEKKYRMKLKERKKKLVEASNHTCYICGQPMCLMTSNMDHVYPRNMVGNPAFNFMPAHVDCNTAKDDRLPSRLELDRWCATYRVAYGKPDRRMWLLMKDHGVFSNSDGSLVYA